MEKYITGFKEMIYRYLGITGIEYEGLFILLWALSVTICIYSIYILLEKGSLRLILFLGVACVAILTYIGKRFGKIEKKNEKENQNDKNV